MKRLKCWITRHKWLLQVEQAISIYAINEQVAESYHYYECQRCGKLERHIVVNLDNATRHKDCDMWDC